MNDGVESSGALALGGEAQEARPVGRRREDRVVGVSAATRRAVEQATAASGSELPVLLTGPRGSGRECLARAVHSWGRRASASFQILSCDALPPGVHARELFGCAAGVHALMPGDYTGLLARGAGGTVVLAAAHHLEDAVAESLRRAIADRAFTREGESARHPLRARVVLTSGVAGEGLLGDLPHHRIDLTPLAERPEDVLPLAAHFLQAFAHEEGVAARGFTAEARGALLQERWPGNVAELRERVRQAVKLAAGDVITPEALALAQDIAEVPSFKEAKRAFETRYVEGLLRRCSGNISRAARLAKKDRKDFYDVIRRTGVDPGRFRS